MASIIITGSDPSTLPAFQPIEQPICGICQTQFSRYTCPHCNLHYCSLSCFRSDSHSSCSEKFDRISLLEEINSSKDKTGEEKQGMLDLLKKFEEEAAEDDFDEVEEVDEEDDVERRLLEEKLSGIDLDTLTSEELLDLLSPAQRELFDTTLRDPAKASKVVDEEFEGDVPWWEEIAENAFNGGIEEVDDSDEESAIRPNLVDSKLLPLLKVGANGKGAVNPLLVYNILAVLFAYSYTLRTFSLTSFSSLAFGSTERNTAIQMFSQLLPFLFEQSTLIFDDVANSIEYVISRENPDELHSDLLALLLKDVSLLLQPASITTLSPKATSPLASHPLIQPLTALSDLHHLFSTSISSAPKSLIKRPSSNLPLPPTLQSASLKIIFYIAFLSGQNSPISVDEVRDISERVGGEAEKREKEGKETKVRIKNMKEKMEEGKRKLAQKQLVTPIMSGAKIQEIQ